MTFGYWTEGGEFKLLIGDRTEQKKTEGLMLPGFQPGYRRQIHFWPS